MDSTFHQENESDPYHVLIMRIGFDKIVNGDHPLYACDVRHRDPKLCHIGALGLWLMALGFIYTTKLIKLIFRTTNLGSI